MSAPSKLLIINNMPAYYRTAPFAALIERFEAETGGTGCVAYQVRRDPMRRGEWFYTPDADIPYVHRYLSAKTTAATAKTGYPLRIALSDWVRRPPTHVLVAGWDSPLSWASSLWGRLPRSTLGMWVESNATTSSRQGRLVVGARRALVRGADFVLVPTQSSASYVETIAQKPVPALHLLNPVSLQRLPDTKESDAEKRMIFLGDFSRRKGFDVFNAVLRAGEANGWTGLAWGRDVEDLGRNSADNVQLMSARPMSQIIPDLRPSDILIIPSRVDPAPLTFSEGLALGLRSVVSDTIAYGEVAKKTLGCAAASGLDAGSYIEAAEILRGGQRPGSEGSQQVSPTYWADHVAAWLLGRRQ